MSQLELLSEHVELLFKWLEKFFSSSRVIPELQCRGVPEAQFHMCSNLRILKNGNVVVGGGKC